MTSWRRYPIQIWALVQNWVHLLFFNSKACCSRSTDVRCNASPSIHLLHISVKKYLLDCGYLMLHANLKKIILPVFWHGQQRMNSKRRNTCKRTKRLSRPILSKYDQEGTEIPDDYHENQLKRCKINQNSEGRDDITGELARGCKCTPSLYNQNMNSVVTVLHCTTCSSLLLP
jgi:hypothetical protein